MTNESKNILLDNLKETLKQFQNYLVLGLLAALSYFLLVLSKSETASVNLQGIVSANSIDKATASTIWICVFWFLGALATYALERIDRICITYLAIDTQKLSEAKELVSKFRNRKEELTDSETKQFTEVKEFINEHYTRLEILKAATTFPSIATEVYRLVRIAPALISIALIVLARIKIWNSNIHSDVQIYEMIILILPYFVIAIQLLKSSLPIAKPEKFQTKTNDEK